MVVISIGAVGTVIPLLFPTIKEFEWVFPTLIDGKVYKESPWRGILPHVVRKPAAASVTSNTLHVFLHGTSAHPILYSDYLLTSSNLGHHTIGLAYIASSYSSAEVGQQVLEMKGDDAKLQGEEFSAFHSIACLGGGEGPFLPKISGYNSIVGRLEKLLVHLVESNPDDGWDIYVGDSGINWDLVMLSGHSQGASHVAYLATEFPLQKAVLLSGPQAIANPQSSFLAQKKPTSRIVAFAHKSEDDIDSIEKALETMGLGPAQIVTEEQLSQEEYLFDSEPYSSANVIFTSVAPRAPVDLRPEHASVAVDWFTPLDKENKASLYSKTLWPFLLDL